MYLILQWARGSRAKKHRTLDRVVVVVVVGVGGGGGGGGGARGPP
jgi:hypothetical protein